MVIVLKHPRPVTARRYPHEMDSSNPGARSYPPTKTQTHPTRPLSQIHSLLHHDSCAATWGFRKKNSRIWSTTQPLARHHTIPPSGVKGFIDLWNTCARMHHTFVFEKLDVITFLI